MAPKRHIPLEDPSAASASSSEEEESVGQEEEEEEEDDVVEGGESENEDEEGNDVVEGESENNEEGDDVVEEGESEDEEDEGVESPVKKSTVISAPSAQPQSSSDAVSDSESGHSAYDFTIKPIVPKPLDDSAKPKKPAPLLPAKRAQPNENESTPNKKAKALKGDEDDQTAGIVKGYGIQRLWSEDDEMAILKGMIDYQSETGTDPIADKGAFYKFIEKSLRVEVSQTQLIDKIRKLKKKYQNNVKKGRNGEDPVFPKPHDCKSFEFSKKIWGGVGGDGNNAVDDHVNNKNITRKSANANAHVVLALSKQEGVAKMVRSNGESKGEKPEEFGSLYFNMNEWVEMGQVFNLGTSFVKEGITLIDGSKAKELDEKWKKLKVDHMELHLKRVDLIREQTALILDAMKSSES
ncbi:hypothetical protein L1049_028055 [Liquidambar formosana]|uniref:Glabrous enhancer-binding protein-like DBD domain-containing protein n=1 Tax=Liquidambar formosana TaxID=63359 RepID=A0AAP0RIB5_LIQFO